MLDELRADLILVVEDVRPDSFNQLRGLLARLVGRELQVSR